jgi:3',5'-cyclic-nucleotide phosphodiesterase
MIELHLIGCNGGIGGPTRQTTCYGIGERLVIDAGTGLGTLSLERLARIDHVVLTHAHLDHVAALPLMADSIGAARNEPLTVWAHTEVLALLRAHLLNDHVWPDFTRLPSAEQPFIQLREMPAGGADIAGYRITPLPADHGIPACGYRVEAGGVAVAFSGDTADCAPFWDLLADDAQLAAVVVECSYPLSMAAMAELTRHMHAGQVTARLAALRDGVAGVVIHRKPGLEQAIARDRRCCHRIVTCVCPNRATFTASAENPPAPRQSSGGNSGIRWRRLGARARATFEMISAGLRPL